jgi:hypothetical protein
MVDQARYVLLLLLVELRVRVPTSSPSHLPQFQHAWEGLGEGRLFGGDTLEGGSGGGRHGGFGRIYTAAMADPSEVCPPPHVSVN